MLSPERLVVSIIVCTFMGDHAQELVVPSVEEAAYWESFRERYLG